MEGTTPTAAPAEATQPQVHPGDPEHQHHINRQPRDFSGRVNGPPRPGAPAPKPEEAPQAEPPPKVRVKYKANGQEVEEELDYETLSTRLARERGAYSKFEEAAKLRKEADSILKDFEEGMTRPEVFRKRLEANLVKQGAKPEEARARVRDILAHSLGELLHEDDLSPEQRRLRELEEREAQRQQEDEDARAEAALEEHRAEVRERAKAFQQRLGAALMKAKQGPLPVTEAAMRAMGQHLLASMRNGVGCTDEELVEVFNDEVRGNVGATLGQMEFSDIERLFPDVVRKIHAGLLAKRQTGRPGARPAPTPAHRQRPAEAEPLVIASDDFEAYRKARSGR